MKPENMPEIFFGLAYYKRRWVRVPLFYAPAEAVTETGELAYFRFIPVDGQVLTPPPKREDTAFDKNWSEARETIVPWLLPEKVLKELCRRNDIHLPWVTGRTPQRKGNSSGDANRRENRKIRSLTSKEFRQIHKELIKIDKQSALIASILWFLNDSFEEAGMFITLEEVIRLRVQDVSPEQETGPDYIILKRTRGNRTQHVSHFLPLKLWRPLCQQINENSMFVFSNKTGGPLFAVQVDEHLKKAAKRAGFEEPITSIALRPPFNKEQVEHARGKYQRDVSVKDHLQPISSEEWEMICEQLPTLKAKRGRKSTYDPRELLNAILFHLRENCPYRKLPPAYPPYKAVHSQYRRWKKDGSLDAMLNLRKITSH